MTRIRRLVGAGLLGVWCWIAACGPHAAPPPVSGPSQVAAAALPWAESYSTESSPGILVGDAADEALRGALVEAAEGAGLSPDGRLARLAEALAQDSATGGATPGAQLITFHARRLGLVEPTPQLWLEKASSTVPVVSDVRDALVQAAELRGVTHCGAAAVRSRDGVIVVVAFVRRLLELARPIPRELALKQSLTLSGRLGAGYKQAVLATTDPRGNVERVELGAGSSLSRRLQFPGPGVYTMELLANGAEGVTVVAVFPVAVGVRVERAPPASSAGEVERDPEAVAARLIALIAAERKQRGLPPLALDAALSRVALAHSTDMHENHFVAHTSRSSGEANDRVSRAGLRTTLLLENIGRGYGAEEIHAGLMESPGHRGNILYPDARAVGVGVVAEVEGERSAFLATELFAKLAEPVNWPTAQDDLFRAVSAARKAKKRATITHDQALSRAAQSAAQWYAEHPSAQDQTSLDRAMKSVRALPKGASALSAALIKAEDLEQVAGSEELLDAGLVALGLGVAPLPTGASHALVVVLLLALRQ